MNDVSLAGNLVVAPALAFTELRAKPRFWFPLLLVIAVTAAMMFWYYSVVDIPWLRDLFMSGNERLAQMPPEQRERMAGAFSRNGMMISGLVSAVVAIPIVCAIQALYYLLAGKVAGLSLSFVNWFTMVTWCALPALVSSAAGAAILASEVSPMQVSPMQLQALSLNELFFHIPMSGKGSALLGSLTLVTPWSWALLTICVKTWTQRSWVFSATFALLPSVLFYGGWAFLAFK